MVGYWQGMVQLVNKHRIRGENTQEQKEAYANSPENLFCIDNNANQGKGDNGSYVSIS